MAKVFLSYGRRSEAIARTLAEDITALGNNVWFDQELSGGHLWWEKILDQIRDCEIFVFVLDPDSLNSTACRREYEYAEALGKPILPVLVSDAVSLSLLPPALSRIQFIDYRAQDRPAALRLARALIAVPPPDPLPDPLPAPPDVPLSYLASLAARIDSTSALSYEEQSSLLFDLKRSLREQDAAEDATLLLQRFRVRRDLYAAVADEIDEILRQAPAKPVPAPEKPESAPVRPVPPPEETVTAGDGPRISGKGPPDPPTNQTRARAAIVGGIVGTVLGVFVMEKMVGEAHFAGLLCGLGFAIAGVITDRDNRLILAAAIGAVIGWIVVFGFFQPHGESEAIAVGGVFGAPIGAVVGAFLGKIQQKKEQGRH